ncbi:MAG: HU family DNA-binding protein [Akkermansia sp.]|nr:HU family DNA-binding protein [Akkermansia sp.]MDO4751885.1 HU family DNA-binding protein [Akkermansia sp.]
MNKTQLVDCIQAKLGEGATKKCAEAALSAVLGSISDAVKAGEKVQLVGFGTFEMKTRAARTGRNPRTGDEMKIEASQTLAFKPSSAFKTVLPAKKTCKKGGCKKKK